jgi:hypothetical protein
MGAIAGGLLLSIATFTWFRADSFKRSFRRSATLDVVFVGLTLLVLPYYGCIFGEPKEGVDDRNKATLFSVGAPVRRSTSLDPVFRVSVACEGIPPDAPVHVESEFSKRTLHHIVVAAKVVGRQKETAT